MSKQEIITKDQATTTEVVAPLDIKNFNQLKQELAEALEGKGMNMIYIADKLNYVLEKAYTLNNKGDEAPDFKTILEAAKVLLKIYGFDLSDKKTQVAIFNNIPAKGEKLNF